MGGRAPVAAEGEERGGEMEALQTRERREAAVSGGGGAGWVGWGWEAVDVVVGFGGCVGRLAQ
jgi:hypothetical protein